MTSRLITLGLRAAHRSYKFLLSPLLGDACRFHPCCSDYALEACTRHGILKGSYLSMKRLLRCNPFCEGGLDPVPGRPATKGAIPKMELPTKFGGLLGDHGR